MPRALQAAVNLIVGDTWPKRRRVIYVSLIFCATVIAYGLGAAVALGDKESIQTASDNAWFYGFSIVMAYVFGSVADDMHKRFEQRNQQPTTPEGE